MEIEAQPSAWRPRGRWAWGLVLLLLLPVTVLGAAPVAAGLERYVVTADSADQAAAHGSMVFERRVPVSDLEPGDVVTFARPDAETGGSTLTTSRVVALTPGFVHTDGQGPGTRPWAVSTLDNPTLPRVVLTVPYAGLPFVAGIGWWAWAALVVLASGLLAVSLGQSPLPRGRAVRVPNRAAVR